MGYTSSNDAAHGIFDDPVDLSTFPTQSQLQTKEQICRFELLRLAFFILKLRKLEQSREAGPEYEMRCNLLRHAIFQQVVTLTGLDAREQAMHLIDTCRT